jgi:hypothetical protein
LFVFLCCLGACQKPLDKINMDYGKPVIYPYPSALWQTTIGGTKDDYVKDVFCCGGYIYIIGESNSSDINFTSAVFGQKLFLGRLDFNGQLKNIWTFAAAEQNRLVKSLIIDDYLYILAEGKFTVKSAVIYKVNLKNGQAFYRVLGSELFDEDALDLAAFEGKLYVIGQNSEYFNNDRHIFIEQLDLNLNPQNFQRFVRGADLTYINWVKTKDGLNVWLNAVSIEYSYPVMIDIGGNEYIYHNYENPFLKYKLLDAKALGDKTLLVFLKEKQNTAAYCFFENGEFESLRSVLKEDTANAELIPNRDYAAVFLNSQNPDYYLVSENFFVNLKNIDYDFISYKCFEDEKITVALTRRGGKQSLLIMKDYGFRILNLETPAIISFWIENDYIITASNQASDIKVTLLNALPYQFIDS